MLVDLNESSSAALLDARYDVCISGSGPAGIAAADQLNKAGHSVTLFEKDKSLGGILRYGIPDFKLKK